MRSKSTKTKVRTVRELGGEIWAELEMRMGSRSSNILLPGDAPSKVAELAMAILARHIGATIADDCNMPVEPLKPLFKENP